MKKRYHILDSAKQQPVSPNDLTRLLSQNSQLMLPLVELVEQCRGAVDEVIDVHRPRRHSSRAGTVGAASYRWKTFPARQEAPRRCGPLGAASPGRVKLSNRKTARQQTQTAQTLRRRGQSARLRSDAGRRTLGARMLDILMKGVSTRNYAGVIGAMAGTAGVSKSAVSREAVEAAEKSIDEVLTRRLDELDLLVIYVDGLIFADHVVLAAVGVDRQGNKHVLGLQHAATESTAAAEDLLRGMVERGVSTEKKQALRARWIEGPAGGGAAGSSAKFRCSAAVLTSCAMSSSGCLRPSAIRPKRRSGPPGGWEPKMDKRGWRS